MAKAEAVPDDLVRVRRLLARERAVDRGAWLRLSGWGVAAIAALTIAAYAYDVSGGFRRDNETSADLIRDLRLSQQALQQQLQSQTKDAQIENKRLAAALATLNSDRDRLYTRVSALEQSLESVTGSLNRQAAALATAASVPFTPPVAQPVASAPAAESGTSKAFETTAALADTSATRTVFGIDLAAGASLESLRAAWRSVAAANSIVAALQPIVVVRDGAAGGTALHLVAGPLADAATAARLCASLGTRDKACEPVAYEGQRLALDVPAAAAPAPAAPKKKKVVRPVPLPTAAPPPPRT